MKGLTTLIKLQKTKVDEQRQFLSKLQNNLDALEQQIAAHEIEKTREQLVAETHPEASLTYGAFIKGAVQKTRQFESERHALLTAVEEARSVLIMLFEEQKRYEIAENLSHQAELKEERRQETLELDEIGSVQFTRKKKPPS